MANKLKEPNKIKSWQLSKECSVEYTLPEHNPRNIGKTEIYKEAVAHVIKQQNASISTLQRYLRVGYNQCARLIETMEIDGVVTKHQQNGTRSVLMKTNPFA